jgi:hypothetical protein
MRIFITIVTIFVFLQSNAQDNLLSNNTIFKDGVYFTFKDFASNQPSLRLDQIHFEKLEGGLASQRYLYNFVPSSDITIDMDTVRIWGICLNGVPYINQSYFYVSDPGYAVVKDYVIIEKLAFTFTRIMMIGHLCHFTAEGEHNGGRPINHLSPELNDFRLSRDNKISQQFLLNASTGEILKFSSNNLLEMIKDDKDLYQKYSDMSSRKRKQEIFNIFREYNSKHPIKI